MALSLVQLTRALVNLADEDTCEARAISWLTELAEQVNADLSEEAPEDSASPGTPPLRPLCAEELSEQALRLQFTVLLAVLSNTLASLLRRWQAVEAPLNLGSARSLLFQRPPEDLNAVVPDPPMGWVLGYQYQEATESREQMGQLRFFRCTGVGRWVLLHLDTLFHADSLTGPAVLLMSGTSWAGTSPRYDVQLPVGAILQPNEKALNTAGQSVFLPAMADSNGARVTVSGKRGVRRRDALRTILRHHAAQPHPGQPSLFEKELEHLPESRRRILLVVGSYREAQQVAEDLVEIRGDWRDQVLHLVADGTEFTDYWTPTLRRGEVSRLAGTGARFLVAPLLAVERGHNILTEDGHAAIGSAYFLVRPHPHPDDISYPVQSMSRWAVRCIDQLRNGEHGYSTSDLATLARRLRRDGYGRWQRLLTAPLVYGSLTEEERAALAWTQLVSIWQVVGRLVRGGCAARVHFCDARFFPGPGHPGEPAGGHAPGPGHLPGPQRHLRPGGTRTR